MHRTAVNGVKHFTPGLRNLLGKNCFFAIKENPLIEEINLLQEIQVDKQTATAHLYAIMARKRIVEIVGNGLAFIFVTENLTHPMP